MIEKLLTHPQKLFLLDGFGAFFTLFGLLLLRFFQDYFGMPKEILDLLACLALAFGVYSLTCFFVIKHQWKPFLQIIILANLLYCGLSLAVMVYYYSQLTVLGTIYFLIEILVLLALVFFEKYVLERNKCFH